jgi:hypothetical protein
MAGKYKVIKGESGKYRIERVPIFKLGDIRGFSYDRGWSERMLANMQRRAESGFYPPVIVGHNGFGSELKEKEAIGFMTNFSVEYTGEDPDIPMGTVYCDFSDIGEERMQDIRDMKYPYRSVEVWNDRAEFSAVALLGGTEPYFKFPRLEVFSAEDGKAVHNYSIENGELRIENDKRQDHVSNGKRQDDASAIKQIMAEMKRFFTGPKIEENNQRGKEEGRDMDAEKFKETYGMSQDEAAKLAAEAMEAKAQVEKLQQDKRAAEKAAFAEKLKGMGVAPAVIEKLQAATDKAEHPDQEMTQFMEILSAAKEDKLFVPVEETGQHGDKADAVDPDDSEALHEAIMSYMEKHKCSYQDAASAVFKEIDKQREGR